MVTEVTKLYLEQIIGVYPRSEKALEPVECE